MPMLIRSRSGTALVVLDTEFLVHFYRVHDAKTHCSLQIVFEGRMRRYFSYLCAEKNQI